MKNIINTESIEFWEFLDHLNVTSFCSILNLRDLSSGNVLLAVLPLDDLLVPHSRILFPSVLLYHITWLLSIVIKYVYQPLMPAVQLCDK